MRVRSLVVVCIVVAAVMAALTLHAAAAVNSPEDSSAGGAVQVSFNSVQLDTSSPQAYAFGVAATAVPGSTITKLHWEFGDGIFLDVPYCCESQVSEVRYHAYQQPGTYTVLVIAVDTGGNVGEASVTVSWPTPIPEFPVSTGPLLASAVLVLTAATILRRTAPSTRRAC